MKRLFWIFSLLFILAVSVGFLTSCAGTQADPYSDEGLAPDEGGILEGEGTSGEEDVLRLLGITDEESTKPAEEDTAVDNMQVLQEEINRLENEVSSKDREVATLQAQLQEKDAILQQKEQDLARVKASGGPVSYSGAALSSFRARYDQALSLYNSRRYNEAIAAFDQLLNSGENNSLIDNCQYWKGEAYYGLSNYEQAILEFQKVFAYPNSNKLDDAQLKLGLCYMKLNNYDRAKLEFEKLLREYPDSEYVGRARSYLSRL